MAASMSLRGGGELRYILGGKKMETDSTRKKEKKGGYLKGERAVCWYSR